jgi:hypothetical protein
MLVGVRFLYIASRGFLNALHCIDNLIMRIFGEKVEARNSSV